MRFMQIGNVETAHTEWFFISDAVHGLDVVMLIALVQAFGCGYI